MSKLVVAHDGGSQKTLRLTSTLGQGGAGAVYAVHGHPSLAVKLYKPDVAAGYQRKIRHMLSHRPALDEGWLAWPQMEVRDGGRFAGFVMPRMDTQRYSASLFDVCNRMRRRHLKIASDWAVSATVGRNLCVLVQALHDAGYCIVDFNPANFGLDRGRFLLLDCDGFTVMGSNPALWSQQYSAGYACPESRTAVGRNVVQRGVHQDRFALAVVLFQLLNRGMHPTAGLYAGDVPPTEQEKLDNWLIPCRPGAPAQYRHPRRSLFFNLPSSMQRLFSEAFDRNAVDSRPSAERWRRAFQRMLHRLSTCSVDPEHPRIDGHCLGCDR